MNIDDWLSLREKRECAHGDPDQRNEFQRDKDRILYSSAFRRLSGITQIVRAGEEDVFHDRLIHSIKVAQVGRRLAEKLRKDFPACKAMVDPDVVEAACLAHDLGHPPFGHAGEKKLDELIRSYNAKEQVLGQNPDEGFEGNAQSFRIIVNLAVRWPEPSLGKEKYQGLDLTRATLAATLKYPWPSSDKRSANGKWGAYETESEILDWCRDGWPNSKKTTEAAIMDWADDITYSVHDLEDFHRCGAVPWRDLFPELSSKGPSKGAARLIETALKKWRKEAGEDLPDDASDRLKNAHNIVRELLSTVPSVTSEIYNGTRLQRQEIRTLNSMLVNYFMSNTELSENGRVFSLVFKNDAEEVVRLLKAVTVSYILDSPALQAQQIGQSAIIEDLFGNIYNALKSDIKCRGWFPRRFDATVDTYDDGRISAARATADCICSMTEREAIALRNRLKGVDGGSVMHPIVR